ncbi:hypothetical protein NM688_g9002 [Phlebia brevispora]|uniref:Uncharacterized protein n=1 Tax=Phlebia brevispora TaxID=194682 RepID=A0ACC1RP33_9APHY|nr:hypothetical protein NM688_g9002 [Phlebia brevispora]
MCSGIINVQRPPLQRSTIKVHLFHVLYATQFTSKRWPCYIKGSHPRYMDLFNVLFVLATQFYVSLPGTYAQSCVAKCPLETLDGWPFIPYSDLYSSTGTSCYYQAPCNTQGIGYYLCTYFTNGTLDIPYSWGEECGPGGDQKCPSTTRTYCPPPPGVSCTVNCPATDGWGDTLVSTSLTNVVVCEYTSSIPNEESECGYYADTGGLAVSNMEDPTGLKTCPIQAGVSCTTTATAPTPTPSTPCAAACPNGGCVVSCPTSDVIGYDLISAGEYEGTQQCLYGFPGGMPRNECAYDDDTGAWTDPMPSCYPTASISCATSSSTPTPTPTPTS